MASPGLTLEQVNQLEQTGNLDPQTADRLRAVIADPKAMEPPIQADAAAIVPPMPGVVPSADDFSTRMSQIPVDIPAARPNIPTPPPVPSAVEMPGKAGGTDIIAAASEVPPPATIAPASTLAKSPAEPAALAPLGSGFSQMENGFQAQQGAIMEAKFATQQAQTGIVAEQVKQAQMLEEARQQEEKAQLEKKQRIDAAESLYKQSLADLQAQKIDPNRLYNNTSTGDKIVGAIAIALGGISAGMSGRKNAAYEVIENAIDRDIKSQEMEIAKKEKGVAVQGSLFNELVGRLQNEDVARHYLKSLMLEQGKSVIESYQSQITNATQQAQLSKLYGELEVANGEAKAKAQEVLQKSPAMQAVIRDGVTQGKIDPSTLDEKDRERYVQGLGFAKDAKAADDISASKEAYDTSVRLIDQIIDGRKKEGGGIGAAYTKLQQGRAAELILKFKDLAKLGALNEGDYDLLYSIIPKDPSEFNRADLPVVGGLMGDPIIAQMDRLKGELKSKYQGKLKTLIQAAPEAENLSTDLKLTPR